MRTITYVDALTALNEVVKMKGYGFVYERKGGDERPQCYNVWEGKPDCIVGHVLVWLGVPVEAMSDSMRCNMGIARLSDALRAAVLLNVEDNAVDLLAEVQAEQDEGAQWGAAVVRAHLGLEEYNRLNLHEDVA